LKESERRHARVIAAAAVALLGLLASPAARDAGENFRAIFGEKYAEAENYLKQNTWIVGVLHLQAADTQCALAVVFPEIIRYSYLQDRIQVRALKVLYVQYGRKYADFSVGHFQMKPSFIELLESDWNTLASAEEKAAAGIPAFAAGDRPEARGERVRRLDDLGWQARYLRLFMLVMKKRYGHLVFKGAEDRLRFYATAYNAGYAAGEARIRRALEEKRFHLELFAPKRTYNYADVAVHFYRRPA
jgi:hypothetical protein